MLSKNTLIGACIVLAIVAGVSAGIRWYQRQDSFQLKNQPCQKISYIEVMNRGLPGKPAIYFKTKDSISFIAQQLMTSPPVTVDHINWAGNRGGCEIVLHYPNHQLRAITFMDMKTGGGIISLGAYHYHNDALLQLFRTRFAGGR